MEKRHKDMDKIYDIMVKLIWGDPLPERCREHNLSGDYKGLTDSTLDKNPLLMVDLPQR